MSYRPTRNVFLLGLTSFFNDFSSEMVLSAFPAFFISVLRAGAGSLGLAEGIADGASNVIKIYSGRFSDKLHKRKPFIIAGYALSVITRPLYLAVGSVAGVVGLRVTDRIGKGLREGPRDAMISLSTSKEQLGRAFGFHRMMDSVGAILGPLLVYAILRANPNGFGTVFLVAFFVGILAVVSLWFVREARDRFSVKNIALASPSLYSASFKRYLIALLFLSMGTIPVAVLLLVTQRLGFSLASIPLFYSLYSISYTLFSFWGGSISDRRGPKTVLYMGYIILIIGYSMVLSVHGTIALAVCFAVLGLFPALTDGVQRALASQLSPAEKRGGALGLVNAVGGVGLLCAGIGGGYMWEHAGPAVACGIAVMFIFIGIIILSTVKHHRQGTI